MYTPHFLLSLLLTMYSADISSESVHNGDRRRTLSFSELVLRGLESAQDKTVSSSTESKSHNSTNTSKRLKVNHVYMKASHLGKHTTIFMI